MPKAMADIASTPSIHELPPPPPARSGWPWTEGCPALPPCLPDGSPWPRISVVTPSFNQAAFLEETIRSVLLQGYPNLEYIVVDGGSTDGSVDIIRRYKPWLSWWVSEPDAGQTDAIRKGVQRASGEVLAWLNSDDFYCPDTLGIVGARFALSPAVDLLYGDCDMIDDEGRLLTQFRAHKGETRRLLAENFIPQPSTFCRACVWNANCGVDAKLQYVMDHDLWIRLFLSGVEVDYLPATLSRFRYHSFSKTGLISVQFGYEFLTVLDKLSGALKSAGLESDLLKAYNRTFRSIITLHERGANSTEEAQVEIMRVLNRWTEHLEAHLSEYRRYARLLGHSYYGIGKHYCLLGRMKEGKRFLEEALRLNGGILSRALPGRIAASLGKGLFTLYSRKCAFLSEWFQRHRT